MTNHWIDIRNADVILIMGSNAAENHPISFRYVTEAQQRGATLISVDPRFTRTSSKADIYAPMRSGSDIPFIGGMINYILQNKLYHEEYVRLYTNGPFILNPGFKMPGELGGVFSGYDEKARKYDKSAWAFKKDRAGVVLKDDTMQDPMSVLQLLKKQYSRYDMDTVSAVTGTPKDLLEKVYAGPIPEPVDAFDRYSHGVGIMFLMIAILMEALNLLFLAMNTWGFDGPVVKYTEIAFMFALNVLAIVQLAVFGLRALR